MVERSTALCSCDSSIRRSSLLKIDGLDVVVLDHPQRIRNPRAQDVEVATLAQHAPEPREFDQDGTGPLGIEESRKGLQHRAQSTDAPARLMDPAHDACCGDVALGVATGRRRRVRVASSNLPDCSGDRSLRRKFRASWSSTSARTTSALAERVALTRRCRRGGIDAGQRSGNSVRQRPFTTIIRNG